MLSVTEAAHRVARVEKNFMMYRLTLDKDGSISKTNEKKS